MVCDDEVMLLQARIEDGSRQFRSLSTIVAAYREFEARLERTSSGHGSKTEIVLNAIGGFIGDFSLSDIERACPAVGRDWIRTLLKRLKQEGRVEALGKGRYARWRRLQ